MLRSPDISNISPRHEASVHVGEEANAIAVPAAAISSVRGSLRSSDSSDRGSSIGSIPSHKARSSALRTPRWLQLLCCTRQRVKRLQEKLAEFAARTHKHSDADSNIKSGAARNPQYLETVLVELAAVLRSGPPGSTLEGTSYLLTFLQHQQGSPLREKNLRNLLKRVRRSLRQAARLRPPQFWMSSSPSVAQRPVAPQACTCYSSNKGAISCQSANVELQVASVCDEVLEHKRKPSLPVPTCAPRCSGATTELSAPDCGGLPMNELENAIDMERLPATKHLPGNRGVRNHSSVLSHEHGVPQPRACITISQLSHSRPLA